MTELGPEPSFRSAARKLPLACCTLLLELPLSPYDEL